MHGPFENPFHSNQTSGPWLLKRIAKRTWRISKSKQIHLKVLLNSYQFSAYISGLEVKTAI